jgi:hypothetical protein
MDRVLRTNYQFRAAALTDPWPPTVGTFSS